MRIFVTGGAGYIGSAATQILLEAGHQVTVYDSLVSGYRAAIPQGATFIQADLANPSKLAEALGTDHFDAVMHFAAFIEAGESMVDPGKYFHNNTALSMALLEACMRAGVDRFVLSSTAAVYATSDEPLDERAALAPSNVYGQSKLMIEQTLEWYRQVYGLRYAALRYFNAAGALEQRGEAHQPESHLIPLVLQVALGQRDNVQIYGSDYPTPDGTCIRDYIHISDLIHAHLLSLAALEEHDHLVYNLGNGAGYSVREVIETARSVSGHAIPAIETDRRPGDAPRLVASSAKIQKELGWQPAIPNLKDILASAWDWHRHHPDGYPSTP
ncbi:MAG: UDP-glucose 4-epimerase GalE [Anaerolineales bacterium]|nr:MAG: UDP-glucose 4-epimerase GalE [Anaerolineales bacterium]